MIEKSTACTDNVRKEAKANILIGIRQSEKAVSPALKQEGV